MVKGSNLNADSGDISLSAEQNVNIVSATNTNQSSSKETHASAEVNLTAQNEYAEAAKAYLAVEEARKQLQHTKSDYKKYKGDLSTLESSLNTLEQEYANKTPGIDKDDLTDMRELIDDVKDDEKYYLAAIAAATVNLTSKTTIAIQQSAAAASSSGTYGFSVGLSLDVEGSKSKTNTNSTKSIGSTLTAQNISVTTKTDNNNQTTIQGSAVKAQDNLTINTGELNVIASTDTSTHSQDSENINGSVSMSVYGAASGPQVSMGYGENHSQTDSLTNNNAQLNATNISTTTTADTHIKGGNLEASELLTMMVGGDLNIESQKDSYSSNSNGYNVSAGFGLGNDPDYVGDNKAEQAALNNTVGARSGNGEIASVNGGYGASTGRTRQKTTVLSSATGSEVNVEVANNTHLKGSLLAAGETDANGTFQDNGNLSLTTETLTYTNTSNTNYGSSNSFNVSTNVGLTKDAKESKPDTTDNAKLGTVDASFAMSRTNEKSKTLATIGQGNVTIANTKDSDDIERLNRDTDKVNKELYAVNQSAGAEMVVDTRLFSETGRNKIAEDMLITDMFRESIERIITTERVGAEDFFSETGRQLDIYNSVKQLINDDLSLAAKLQDPSVTAEAKQKMLDQLTHAAIQALGYDAEGYENKIIAKSDDIRQGFYSEEKGDAYINDHNISDTEGLVLVAGHEMSHALDDRSGDLNNYSEEDRETYADNIGEDFADYANTALGIHGYGSMASSNTHSDNTSSIVVNNNTVFDQLDKSKGDNIVPAIVVFGFALELIDKGLTAYDAYQLEEALSEGRVDDAKILATELGVGLATEAIPGNKIAIKVVGVVKDTIKKSDSVDAVKNLKQLSSVADDTKDTVNIGKPTRVRAVNGRTPINSKKYAGKTIPLKDLPVEIRNKYPHSVSFNGAGYPDFTPYAQKKVKIELTGNRAKDFALANKKAGYIKTPTGFTWHHHQEGGIMQLIPTDLHTAVKHTGGVATSGIKPYK